MSVEWKAIKSIEQSKKRKQPLTRYLMLEANDINWFWDERDVLEFDRLFKLGYSIQQLAKYFKRPTFEIALLTIDRDLQGKLGEYEEN